MDTSRLKKFAPQCREDLIDRIGVKLDYVLTAQTPDLAAQAPLLKELERALAREGRTALLERVAYTWFNRFAAFRYLDAKGWHPFRARLITAASPDAVLPELLQQVRTGVVPEELRSFVPITRINDLLDGRLASPNPQAEVQRLLVIGVSQYYAVLLPTVFDRIDAFTELLLPDDLLTAHSVVHGFVDDISDEDCAEVEVLGWLYQFYISDRKDTVMGRKSAVPTEDIPAVTQLFTPHWIVRYLVENSLGRLWLLNRPNSRLRDHMPYYIEGEAETDFLQIANPEEIKLLDPAVGSGHMLTYAFDLLYLIYEEEGHTPTEIPALILRHNLFGLEICSRAAQLAEMALIFKAREKSRRFLQAELFVRPQIVELRDVSFEEGELRDYIKALGLGDLFNQPMLKLLHQFEEAKNFGSLIQPVLDERLIGFARRAIEAKDLGGQLFLRETHRKVLRVLEQAETLTQRYHIVVANPPYMGSSGMNAQLAKWAKGNYPSSKTDLFAMFMERALGFILTNGYMGMINLPSWLFLSSFESVRKKLIATSTIESMLHMGRGIFGIDWGSIAFVLRNALNVEKMGHFFRLHKRNFQHIYYEDIGRIFLNANKDKSYRYDFDEYRDEEGTNEIPSLSNPEGLQIYFKSYPSDFKKIPGSPVAYWVSTTVRQLFAESKGIDQIAHVKHGMSTGCNARFLRLWHEVETSMLGLGFGNRADAEGSKFKWFPYNKGGNFRKWYGNNEYVVDYFRGGEAMVSGFKDGTNRGFRHDGREYYFRPGVTWSFISSAAFGVRYAGAGSVFDVAGSSAFPVASEVKVVTAYLCSILAFRFMQILNPTFNFQVGNVATLPWNADKLSPYKDSITSIAEEAIQIAQKDWDNFETSWEFRDQPLLRPGLKGATLEAGWQSWEAQSTAAIRRMQELETENNRLFIAAYGLESELQPEVPEAQITLARADARNDMASFLSYAVGCMMGRYSLDQPGLVLANAGDTLREYLDKVGRAESELTFVPDADGIIPVLDSEWFEDDIVARTRDFLRATFGPASLEENVAFIEESLGKDLRKYFTANSGGFYADHLQTYKKRPIYWMFESPKKHFRALIYLHRYNKDTVNRLLNGYLREFRHKLTHRIDELQNLSDTGAATAVELKALDKTKVALKDVEDYERELLLPLARQQLTIDLDDGVKVNYLKFGKALATIPGLAAKEK